MNSRVYVCMYVGGGGQEGGNIYILGCIKYVMGNTNINLDEDLKQKAKEAMINISAVTEKAIKDKLNIVEVVIKDACEFCGKDEVKASKSTNYIGLTWLCPDERWICESCLDKKKR